MSNPLRPPVGSQPTLAGRMMPPVCATGPPPVIPVLPNAYGMVAAQPHQYIAHSPYSQNLQNIQNRVPVVGAVSGPIPGMYMPIASINASLVPPNIDPAKLIEEQRRIEKERNFQLQQQRLKQFTIAGKKGNINADNLIDSMFGKVPPKLKPASTNSSITNIESNKVLMPSRPFSEMAQPPHVNIIKQEIQQIPPTKQAKKDKKEIDAMMRECSDLSGPQKASTFTKRSVKELTPAAQPKYTFTASNKARDWKNLQGLDEVFVANKPRFPDWCNQESVPELYRQIETIVTNNGTHAPDTKLLFPIFISSGLSHQILGQIWELVNHSAPGYLTVEEMYAALALIAVTQAGHPVKTVDILLQLPACPIPQLQCFANQPPPVEEQSNDPSSQIPSDENSHHFAAPKEPPHSTSHQVLRPSAISLKDVRHSSSTFPNPNGENITNAEKVGATGSGFTSSPDDDFDDFKSATPTAVNFSMNTPSSDWAQSNDDFDDFKQAPSSNSFMTLNKDSVPKDTSNKPSVPALTANKDAVPTVIAKPPILEQDLMSPEEDKYSVFRSLQQDDDSSDWGDFSLGASNFVTGSVAKPTEANESSQNNAPVVSSEFLPNPTVLVTNNNDFFNSNLSGRSNTVREDDDFGDFLHADIPPSTVASVTSQLEGLNTNFADFANFKEPEFHQVPPVCPKDSSQLDDEFGDFASSLPVLSKPDLGHEFLFHHVKDNISLAESQSVSSLELGTFDGGGHSGESKSSLSRQGSIPSLDLKNVYLEGADNEEFGDFQSPAVVNRGSKSPSPAKDVKVPESNNSSTASLSLAFQNTRNVPLADKYSVIRAEERKEEDQHISCWVRCLQSSVNILQNTKKIFNQMSCSSVCNEVLRSEEGENYIKDVIEVYKVLRRIAVSSKSTGKQTIPMLDLLNDADQAWNTICGFFAGSSLMPEDSSLEFSNAVLNTHCEDNTKACGLCLLNIDIKTKSRNKEEILKLSYGGRNYHSTCANLWVNCVDPLLPALILPQLL